MTDTSHTTFVDTVAESRSGAPHIAGTAVALTQHNYSQAEAARGLTSFAEPAFDRFAQSSGVERRSLAMPLERYAEMSGFTEANAAYLEVATELGEKAVRAALEAANVDPKEVDAIVTVSSTGVAVPTIDARIVLPPGSSARRQAHSAVRPRLRRGRGRDWRECTTTYGGSPGTWPFSCRSNSAR